MLLYIGDTLTQHCGSSSRVHQAVGLMVSATDKSTDVILLWEKNVVSRLISQTDKFKRQLGPLPSHTAKEMYSVYI